MGCLSTWSRVMRGFNPLVRRAAMVAIVSHTSIIRHPKTYSSHSPEDHTGFFHPRPQDTLTEQWWALVPSIEASKSVERCQSTCFSEVHWTMDLAGTVPCSRKDLGSTRWSLSSRLRPFSSRIRNSSYKIRREPSVTLGLQTIQSSLRVTLKAWTQIKPLTLTTLVLMSDPFLKETILVRPTRIIS